tara:strand:- start:1407 stop:1850 length:444 start_codon:yes stop_codon:yes gene_type:complete
MPHGPRELIKSKTQPLREARALRRQQADEERKCRADRLAATAVSLFSKTGDDLGFIAPAPGIASDFVIRGSVPVRYTITMENISITGDTGEEIYGSESGDIPLSMLDTIRCFVTDMDNIPTEAFVGFLFTPTGKQGVVVPHNANPDA